MLDWKALLKKLDKFKAPLIVLLIGIVLLTFPDSKKESDQEPDESACLQLLLEHTEGVGKTKVQISEHGVVVVCQGAENPKVRLDILHAVASYTGFGSDRITVLKMSEQMGR